MPHSPANPAVLLIRENLADPRMYEVGGGVAAVFTTPCADKPTPNEDAAGVYSADDPRGVLVIADGFGGQPLGDQAAELAVRAVIESVEQVLAADGELQAAILGGFDRANAAVQALGVGAATTLAVVEIDNAAVRPYHVGDSEVLVVGQRGRIKLQTISHSPVGYSVEAGVLDVEEALRHEDRNVVSNMVGSPDMRIDVGPIVNLARRDTVLVGTDGLFDNLTAAEITEVIRKGNLHKSASVLMNQCRERMNGAEAGVPCKPDDLTFAAFRRG